MKFKIGDQVWVPRFDSSNAYVTCPDCGGTGRLRVTFHDETTVSIHCQNCSVGYDPPTGRVRIYDRKPTVLRCLVSGMEINTSKITYRVLEPVEGYTFLFDEADVFEAEDAAMDRAAAMAEEARQDELKRVYRKERDTRTWAWNASYHRNEIKRAQKSIEYHMAKLSVAALKAKEDKKAISPAA